MAGRRQTESAGGGGGGGGPWGPGDGTYAYGDGGYAFEGNGTGAGAGRGATGVRETDMQAGGRRSEGSGMRDARRVPLGGTERDMYGQTSLERLEEENSSLRAITKYLIHERKELRKKADMASKRNQNLNNLLQVMKWSLQQGGSGGVSGACGRYPPPPHMTFMLPPPHHLTCLAPVVPVVHTLAPVVFAPCRALGLSPTRSALSRKATGCVVPGPTHLLPPSHTHPSPPTPHRCHMPAGSGPLSSFPHTRALPHAFGATS